MHLPRHALRDPQLRLGVRLEPVCDLLLAAEFLEESVEGGDLFGAGHRAPKALVMASSACWPRASATGLPAW